VPGQEPGPKPKELETLGQNVGYWTTEVTSHPAVWTPQEINYRCSSQAEFVLNDWFVKHIEVNHIVDEPDKVGKSIWFQSFDTASAKYVTWAFQSSGNIAHSTGTWDEATRTLHHSEVEPPPNTTSKFTETYPSPDSIHGSIAFVDNNGRTMFDMVWTRTRQAAIAGKPLAEQWAAIGTPIQPIPDEVKKLEMFVGVRDVEFIQRPSLTVPQGSTAKGTMSGRWILDGRFLLGETQLPTFQSQWVIGYDTNKRAFRYVLFGSNGRIDENIGLWSEADRVFDWKLVNGPPELTRTSTTRRLNGGRVESHILAKTRDGQTQMDLTIRATPRQ
jgi:hypothetical protein